jgi:hypothetical protein
MTPFARTATCFKTNKPYPLHLNVSMFKLRPPGHTWVRENGERVAPHHTLRDQRCHRDFGHPFAQRKKGCRSTPFSFAVQAPFVNRSVFFCLRPERRRERAHPLRVKVGRNYAPFPPCLVGGWSGKSRTSTPYTSPGTCFLFLSPETTFCLVFRGS